MMAPPQVVSIIKHSVIGRNSCPAAVKKYGRPSVEVEQAVLDAGEREGNLLRRNLRLFNAISNVSPLLGLLGTVWA